jgi:hypothetical protein
VWGIGLIRRQTSKELALASGDISMMHEGKEGNQDLRSSFFMKKSRSRELRAEPRGRGYIPEVRT